MIYIDSAVKREKGYLAKMVGYPFYYMRKFCRAESKNGGECTKYSM